MTFDEGWADTGIGIGSIGILATFYNIGSIGKGHYQHIGNNLVTARGWADFYIKMPEDFFKRSVS